MWATKQDLGCVAAARRGVFQGAPSAVPLPDEILVAGESYRERRNLGAESTHTVGRRGGRWLISINDTGAR